MATYTKPYSSDGAWFVRETGDDGITVSVRLTGPDDNTAGQRVAYDARCGYCWLGGAHSAKYHEMSLRRNDNDLHR